MATSLMMPAAISRMAPNPPNWAAQHPRVTGADMGKVHNTQWAGLFQVPGTVAVAGTPDVPVSRAVALFNKKSRRIAEVTVSDTAGNYVFRNVSRGPWFVLSFDHTGEYNAVIADNIYGEPM